MQILKSYLAQLKDISDNIDLDVEIGNKVLREDGLYAEEKEAIRKKLMALETLRNKIEAVLYDEKN